MTDTVYSDWFETSSGTVYVGGADGSARLHSVLASPLAGEGNYCRDFHMTENGAGYTFHGLGAAFDSGNFYQIPNTKAISLRAWVRTESDGSSGPCLMGIMAKSGTTGIQNQGSYFNNGPPGYFLYIGNLAGAQTLRFRKASATNTSPIDTQILSVSANTWYKIRLDVTPVGDSQDIIEIYTGTGATGSETWNLEHTQNILNTDAQYVPWASATAPYVGFHRSQGSNGGSPDLSMYIDRWQCLLENL